MFHIFHSIWLPQNLQLSANFKYSNYTGPYCLCTYISFSALIVVIYTNCKNYLSEKLPKIWKKAKEIISYVFRGVLGLTFYLVTIYNCVGTEVNFVDFV